MGFYPILGVEKLPPLFRRFSTAEMGSPHIWGVSHVHGGQRPISLEYQIYLPAIDTIVTGMADPSVGLCVSKPSANYWVFQSLLSGTVHSEWSGTEADSVRHYCFSQQPAAF